MNRETNGETERAIKVVHNRSG